jgi:hypothetical protein
VLFAGLAQSSFGAIITNGHFDFSGTFFVTNPGAAPVVTPAGTCPIGISCIFWTNGAGTNVGKVAISSTGLPNGDIPSALSGNDAANISALMNPPEIVGGAGFANQVFMTFNNAGVITELMINFIDPGIYSNAQCGLAPAVGQQCTPTGSLFNFVNNPPLSGEATASWVFEGGTAGNSPSHWTGNFTSQFPLGTPYQAVLSQLVTHGFVENTFSGTITLTGAEILTPEPGSLVLMITGLIGLSTFLLRRTAK